MSFAEPAYSATPKVVWLEAGVPAFIIVDSNYGKPGPFTLTLSFVP